MQDPRRTGFDALDLARQAAILVLELLRPAPLTMRALTDQALRAVTSVPLNLAEGTATAEALLGRVSAMTWRLVHPGR